MTDEDKNEAPKMVQRWGHSVNGSELFTLPEGADLPEGYYDTPAKVPGYEPASPPTPPERKKPAGALVTFKDLQPLIARIEDLTDEVQALRDLATPMDISHLDVDPQSDDGVSLSPGAIIPVPQKPVVADAVLQSMDKGEKTESGDSGPGSDDDLPERPVVPVDWDKKSKTAHFDRIKIAQSIIDFRGEPEKVSKDARAIEIIEEFIAIEPYLKKPGGEAE